MAEEVKIVDVAGGPAAEATLQEILKIMKQRAGSSGGADAGNKAAAKAQDLYNQSVNRGVTAKKGNTKALETNTSALSAFGKGLLSITGLIGSAFGAVIGITKNFVNALTNATTIGEVFEAIPIFGSVLSQATGYFQEGINTFRQLSEVGAGFGNDMMAMRNAAAASGLSLEMFSQMVSNNSEMLGLLGGTTSDGAARLGQLTKRLRSSDMGLMSLGFTQEQLNEGMAAYIEMQAKSGRLQGQTDAQLVEGAKSYLTELDLLSKTTGKSRKELQDEMNQRLQAANFNILAARLSGKALENFTMNTQHTSSMLGSGFADVMTDLADGVAQSDFAKTLASSVPGLQDLAEANARGELSQAEYQTRLQALMPQITKFADNLGAAGAQQLQGKAGFAEFMESLSRARTYQQRLTDANAAAAEQAKRKPLTDLFANFEQTIQNIRSTFEKAFIDSGVLEFIGTELGKGGENLLKGIQSLANTLKDYLGSEQFKKDFEAFKVKLQEIKDAFQKFIDDAKQFGIKKALENLFKGDGKGIELGPMVGDFLKGVFKSFLPSLDTVLVGVAAGVAALIFAPVAAPFLAIGAALAAMFGWSTIKGWVSDAWEGITGMFSGIANWWKNTDFAQMLSNTWNSVTEWFGGIGKWWSELDFRQMLNNTWDKVKSWFSFGDVSFSIIGLGVAAWEKVKSWFSFGDTNFSIIQLGSDAWTTVKSWFDLSGTSFSFSQLGKDAWENVKGWFSLDSIEAPKMSEIFGGLGEKLKSFVDFDIKVPNFKEYLPTWLGGGGKPISELLGAGAQPGTQATGQLAQSTAATPGASQQVVLNVSGNVGDLANLSFTRVLNEANQLKTTLSEIGKLESFNQQLEKIRTGLDFNGVNSYNKAMVNLVETLGKLNDVLATKDKSYMSISDIKPKSSDIVKTSATVNSSTSDEYLSKLDRLNMIMLEILSTLEQGTTYQKRTSRAVQCNLQVGI